MASSLAIATVAPPHPRRLPPPCWSHDETAALIDAYREKWYSLRRGNLRAGHWQEVADSVASRCPPSLSSSSSPLLSPPSPKTPVQCRHKMEKLRKRYRNDLSRSLARVGPGMGPVSSWVHFARMHAMERGDGDGPTVASPALGFGRPCPEENNDDDEELYQSIRHGSKPGIRIKIPSDSGKFGGGFVGATRVVGNGFASPGFGISATKVVGNRYEERLGGKRRRREKGGEGVAAALRALGDGYVRVEKMKMEMVREVEAMRMEMEMKRTEMILEAQQRIVQAFASAVSEKKNNKGES